MVGEPGRRAGGIGLDVLALECQEEPHEAVGESEDEPAVVKDAVVAGVLPDVALIHVDVVDAVQAVGVAELDVDRLVQVPVELCAEREDLAARGLALVR